MENVKEKLDILLDALKSLKKGITLFYKYEGIFQEKNTPENKEVFESMRDSLIQRFEYSIDILSKIIKVYLEEIEKVPLEINSPRGIIREAVNTRLLSEKEGKSCMKIIEARNKTSHTYHEIMAEEIAQQIPEFYELMQKIADRMQKRWE